jgi:predicted nucleic acid-binding protein
MAVVVSDSSPLICLAAIRCFELLRLLYGGVLIPEAVWQEITRAPAFAAAASLQVAADARGAGWLQVATAVNRPLVTQLETTLDPGEAEAIALAVERASTLLLIDERDGRQVARTLGVPLTGHVGCSLARQSPRSYARNQAPFEGTDRTTSFSLTP